jgi:hypothetical protein
MRLFPAFLLAPLSLAGQGGLVPIYQIPPATAPTPHYAAEDLCSVEGRLVNSVTGEPVRRGTLSLLRVKAAGGVPGYAANSDADGRFALQNVEPGKYSLTSDRNGFMTAWYGADGSFRHSTLLTLDRGQKLTGVVLKMTPKGVVAGRILDESGEPVSNAVVWLARFQHVQGRKELEPTGGSTFTNDLGEYRVFDVSPGKYYLSARYLPRMAGLLNLTRAPQDEEEYVTTYFPGTADIASAAPIEVGPGGQIQSANLRLLRLRTVRIKGKVTGLPPLDHVAGISLTLLPRSSPNYPEMNRVASIGPGATFEIAGVSPGAYTLVATVYARSETHIDSYSVRQPLDAGAADLNGVVVAVAPPLEVNGRIRVEGTAPASLKGLTVTLMSPESYGGFGSKPLDGDLTFKLENVYRDRYYVSASPLPDGYYLKAVRAGSVDALAAGLDLTGGAAPPLDIVIGANAARVTGVVRSDDPQRAVAGSTVALIPQEKERRGRESYYKTTPAGDDGRFAFRDVPPGEYKLFAWEEVESDAYLDPEFVQPQESKGEAVTVHEGDRLNVQVKLIPAEPAEGSR